MPVDGNMFVSSETNLYVWKTVYAGAEV